MKIWMEKTLKRFGRPVVVRSAEGAVRVHGIFQSVNSRSWQNMERMFFPLGEIHRGQYICVLPISVQAFAGDTLRIMGKFYKLRRVEEMFVKDQRVYRWCLCVEKGRDDDWGSSES
jgi:hypothetical protein